MHCSDKEKLLRETIQDRNYQAFRSQTFQIAKVEFQKRQRRSTWPLPLALAASVLIAALSVSDWIQPETLRSLPERRRADRHLAVVNSAPLEPRQVVRSVANHSLLIETAGTGGAEVVETTNLPITEIGDSELLAIFGSRPAGFVRRGDHSEFIVIAN